MNIILAEPKLIVSGGQNVCVWNDHCRLLTQYQRNSLDCKLIIGYFFGKFCGRSLILKAKWFLRYLDGIIQKQPSRGVLKICSKFTGEHPCRSVILIKLLSNFIEITPRHGCSANLLYNFRTPFPRNTPWRPFKVNIRETKVTSNDFGLLFLLRTLSANSVQQRKQSPASVL